jgi:predicted Rdx family selenoprotein
LASAASLATALEKEFGIVPDLNKGSIGMFDVYVNDRVIYSNRREGGRLPRNEEVLEKIHKYLKRPVRPSARGRQTKQDVPANTIVESGCT